METTRTANVGRPTLAADPVEMAFDHWVSHGWADAANGMALVTSVMRVQQIFLARVETVLRPHGLTFARFEVLRLLGFTRTGTLPIGKIGERLQVHAASVTNAVQRLEADRLVVRRPHPDDGRSVLVTLQPSGRTLVDRCTALLNAAVFVPASLDDDRQRDAFGALQAIRRAHGDWADAPRTTDD